MLSPNGDEGNNVKRRIMICDDVGLEEHKIKGSNGGIKCKEADDYQSEDSTEDMCNGPGIRIMVLILVNL